MTTAMFMATCPKCWLLTPVPYKSNNHEVCSECGTRLMLSDEDLAELGQPVPRGKTP